VQDTEQPDGAGTPGAGPGQQSLNLTPAEVKYFWSFHDGSIMSVDIRQHLWRSWGFCPRHTWALAVSEPEYRLSLHGTAILYEDLLGRAVRAVRKPGLKPAGLIRRLSSRDSCFVCDFVKIARGRVEPGVRPLTERVNQRRRFTAMLDQSQPLWWRRSCPDCLGGNGPPCRQHILCGVPIEADLGEQLARIRESLNLLAESMRWQGPPADLDALASWVEALGWFAGWQYPAAAVGTPAKPIGGGEAASTIKEWGVD
jgi:hypothetical protein